jgi:hypothetical protein
MTALSELFCGKFPKKCKKLGKENARCVKFKRAAPLYASLESCCNGRRVRFLDLSGALSAGIDLGAAFVAFCSINANPFKEPPPLVMVPQDEVEALKRSIELGRRTRIARRQ